MTTEPKGPYSIEECRGIAARCWCDKRTETTEMHVGLAEVVAEAIQKAWLAGRASRYGLRIALAWVLNDAAYKPPEEIGDVPGRWLSRLRQALAEDDKEER